MLKGRKEAPLELCKHLMLKTNSGCKVHCRHGARKAMTLARTEGQKSRSGSQKGQTEDKWLRGFSAPAGAQAEQRVCWAPCGLWAMEWGRQLSVNRMGLAGAGRRAVVEGWSVPAGTRGLSCGTVDRSWGQHVCRLGHENPAVGRS